jgi:hypothetical protein
MKNKIRTHIKLINILCCTIFLSVVLFSYESLTPNQKFTVTLFGWGIALINAITSLIIYKTLGLVEGDNDE